MSATAANHDDALASEKSNNASVSASEAFSISQISKIKTEEVHMILQSRLLVESIATVK